MKSLKKVPFLYNPQINEVEDVDKKEIFESVSNMETNWTSLPEARRIKAALSRNTRRESLFKA